MTAPEDARSVPLVGLPLVVVTLTFFFTALGAIAVGIRTYIRLRLKSFGLDDTMVVFTMMTFIAVAAFTLHGANVGVGTRNAGLNAWLAVESSKWYLFWILMYLSGMVVLKTSVCTTLLRILPPSMTAFRVCVYVLIFLSWAAWCVSFIGVLSLCRPLEATWRPSLVAEGKATCGGQEVMVAISQAVTVASVLTDTGCAVLPGIMLWKTQMAKTSKLEVFALVSIASIASVATIARAPFLSHYADPTNDLTYYEGFMVLFSNVETGIGLFASSLPSIRRAYLILIKSEGQNGSSGGGSGASDAKQHQGNTGIITIGGSGSKPKSSRSRNRFINPTDLGQSEAHVDGGGEWERIGDDGSDKGILIPQDNGKRIRVDQSYAVEMHPVPSRDNDHYGHK
ncbi:hypothetical protein PG993_004107 [Apiospora rasikravindrae]|uniref:Rhodopsin domain-containing protein n=1 Tax=Apiospora rasikravindrae TaxID=990691 RepID=A0ABR1TBU6_9PEZI